MSWPATQLRLKRGTDELRRRCTTFSLLFFFYKSEKLLTVLFMHANIKKNKIRVGVEMALANCENIFSVTSSSSRRLGGLLKAKTDGGVIMGWF